MNASVEDIGERLDREIDKRERANKYMHNMLEDLKTLFAKFEVKASKFEGAFEQHVKEDQNMHKTFAELRADIETVKRLVWMGLGGLVVLAGIMAIIGGRILHVLGSG